MVHDLIPLTQWPTMPAPFSSSGPGEAWVWGDYVLLLQTEPGRVVDLLNQMAGKQSTGPAPLSYPYVITVFYRRDRSPHGASSQPIFVAGLEKMDYVAVALMMKARDVDVGELGIDGGNVPPITGIFTARSRLNLGSYEGPLDLNAARQHLMNVVQEHLSPSGSAVKIGPIVAIHGHPDTGWPAQPASAARAPAAVRRKRRGCLVFTGSAFACAVAFLFMSAIVVLDWWG